MPNLIPGSQILVEGKYSLHRSIYTDSIAAIGTRPNEIDGKNYQQTTFTYVTYLTLAF